MAVVACKEKHHPTVQEEPGDASPNAQKKSKEEKKAEKKAAKKAEKKAAKKAKKEKKEAKEAIEKTEEAEAAAPADNPKKDKKHLDKPDTSKPTKKPKLDPAVEDDKPQCALAVAGQNGNSGGASSSSAAPQPQQVAPNMASDQDMLSLFAPADYHLVPTERAQKDEYMASELVVPAIALKKMKQAMIAGGPELAQHFIGIMAERTVLFNRQEKPGVQKLITADMQKFHGIFWEKAFSHFGDLKIALIILPAPSPMSLHSATWFPAWFPNGQFLKDAAVKESIFGWICGVEPSRPAKRNVTNNIDQHPLNMHLHAFAFHVSPI